MPSRRSGFAVRVEMMEERIALSAAHPGAPGKFAGSFSFTIDFNELMTAQGSGDMTGTGHVDPFGDVTARIAASGTDAPGQLILANPNGTVTFQIGKGSGSVNARAMTGHGRFRLVGGTGAYAGAKGAGTLTARPLIDPSHPSVFGETFEVRGRFRQR